MNLVLIGISGAGKGTQADMLAKQYSLNHISTGELFRQEYEAKSPEGIAAYNYWSKGNWVPDRVTFALLKLHLDRVQNGFVLDGFPRTLAQSQILDDYLSQKNQKVDFVIYLKVSEEEAIERLQNRAKLDERDKGKSREDETEEIIKKRFMSFQQSIAPVLDFYQKHGVLKEVNGERSIEEIFTNIVNIVEKNNL
ncbi:adenylate kinase [Candidatus Gottesmanbacteria bacterium]|nr:adenylate kinase [Candidatus Gottesmanbacteria bacterium]